MKGYNYITDIENVLVKIKASKFIGYAYTVTNEDLIKEKIHLVQQLHPKATHVCYAYRLGIGKDNFRMNDDGEPHGTAGKPILGQIDSFELSNCLVAVVRYFGGTKLGVSGLIEAYKECAKLTLQQTTILQHTIMDYYEIKCAYENVHLVYRLIQKSNATIAQQAMDNETKFIVAIATEQSKNFEHLLTENNLAIKFLENK